MIHEEFIAAKDRLCRWGVRCHHAGRWFTLGSVVMIPVWPWVGFSTLLVGVALLWLWGWSRRQSLALTKRHLESL